MAIERIPVLLWKEPTGLFTAALVEDEQNNAAFGSSADEALSALQDWLLWTQKNEDWNFPHSELKNPRLVWFHVQVRPEYRLRTRRFPCDEQVKLPVAFVVGKNASGLTLCIAPMLSLRFSCHEEDQIKDLASHYVREQLAGMPPAAIARFFPPQDVHLEEIMVKAPSRAPKTRHVVQLHTLPIVAEPLTEKRSKISSRAFGREAEVADIVRRLREDRANVLVVGESGTGKTSLLIAAAREIERDARKDPARDKEQGNLPPMFWQTSGSRVIAGMRYLGQWEQRCEAMLAELAEIDGVLCADSLIEMLRVGGFDAGDSVGAFLLPFLQHRELRMVAECSPAELAAVRRLLPGFVESFQVVPLEQFSGGAAIKVLDQVAAANKQNLRVEYDAQLPALVYRLHKRFLPQAAFPGAASEFLNSLFERAGTTKSRELGQSDALRKFIEQTGLPELFLRDELPLEESEIREELALEVIGQDVAVAAAAGVLTSFKAGVNDPSRPIGVLLFCGPTGVGKTELSKAISHYLFGHGAAKDRLIRLDMSEYGPGSAERLFSAPDGEPSDLIRKLRAQPFCVLLLDEIEKAGPEVFDVLMGAFDEGRLTDRFGRTTSLQSALIVMTSNLGARSGGSLGFGAARAPDYEAEAMAYFRPEFFNRIDAVVAFSPLSRHVVLEIARKELHEVAQREGMVRANLTLEYSPELVEHVAKEGFDAQYGARPLQRAIERLVVAPLARWLVSHKTRNATVKVGVKDGAVAIS
jgi:ATP-dependent Clp protease ATP-binding subunit ClpC